LLIVLDHTAPTMKITGYSHQPDTGNINVKRALPLLATYVPAGFASPADDFMDRTLDLHEYIVKHPSSTFYAKVSGDSMINAGIYEGDILVVDRSLKPVHDKIVLAVINGEWTVKRLRYQNNQPYLFPENDKYKPTRITEEMGFMVWGVVIHVLHKV